MRVLVTGGAGYIGSHAGRELLEQGHEVVVVDDFSHGHWAAVDPRARVVEGSTSHPDLLEKVIRNTGTEAVMHFAAHIEVGESVSDPEKYYRNNYAHTLSLLSALRRTGVRRLIFSSTAAVYGSPLKVPIEETERRDPINPYGRSKMMVEWTIEDFARAYGLDYTILRYFNVAGAHPDGTIGEDHHPETHLIPRVLAGARDPEQVVRIFGTDYPTRDGTCIRDYVHVVDLARAHVLALNALESGNSGIYNVGSESGFTVKEVIAACERVTGLKLNVGVEARRPGDPPALIAASGKIRSELGWKPLYPDMETIVNHAWRWHATHPYGYGATAKERPKAPL